MRKRSSSTGFTLIELLVSMAVIAILVGLAIPAVQAARESARRALCLNNMRQISLALHNYASSAGCLPQYNNGHGYSFLIMILPQLEQKPLYDSFNFLGTPGTSADIQPENTTAARTPVGSFLCPSDMYSSPFSGMTNYAGNRGVGFDKNGPFKNGVFVPPTNRPISIADATDGSANTVELSEWLTDSTPNSSEHPRISIYAVPPQDDVASLDERCQGLPAEGSTVAFHSKGLHWTNGDPLNTAYDHTSIPNGRSCLNGGDLRVSAMTAGSYHSRGVHVIFLDSHASYLSDSIGRSIWHALGTRNGSESLGLAPKY